MGCLPSWYVSLFDRVRYLCFIYIFLGVAFTLWVALKNALFAPATEQGALEELQWTVFYITLSGAVAHKAISAGYLWFQPPKRTLPLFPLFFRHAVQEYLQSYPSVHNVLVGMMFLALVGSFFLPQWFLSAYVGLFGLLCLLDLWRLFYHTYWLVPLIGFVCGIPLNTLRISLGSLYLWSGFSKLVRPEYYTEVVMQAFSDVFVPLKRKLCDPRTFNMSRRRAELVCYTLGGVGVALEMMMGGIFLCAAWWGRRAPGILLLFLAFNLFMHGYIVYFMGWAQGHRIFICWNVMCAALTQVLFVDPQAFQQEWDSVRGGTTQMSFGMPRETALLLSYTWNVLCYAICTVFPVTLLFGYSISGGLSHAHFAPGWYGISHVLLPQQCKRTLSGLGVQFDQFGGFVEHQLDAVLSHSSEQQLQRISMAFIKPKGKAKKGLWDFKDERKVRQWKREMMQCCVATTGDWVDTAFRLREEDSWAVWYNAGPTLFWRCVADHVKGNIVHILHDHWTYKGKDTIVTLIEIEDDAAPHAKAN